MNHDRPRARHRRDSGITIVEAVMCTLIVSIMFVAAMRTASAAAVVQFKASERAQGRGLASALLGEIVQQAYSPPPANPNIVQWVITAPGGGSAVSAASGANRLSFDDVDDYNNYTESPPVNRDGSAIAGAAAYTRQVTVVRVDPLNPTILAAGETGAKRITVKVTRGGRTVATMTAIRTNAP